MRDKSITPMNQTMPCRDTVLVTGGAGFLGSVCAVALLRHGYKVVILDSMIENPLFPFGRLENFFGRQNISLIKGDIRDDRLCGEMFAEFNFDSVFHFAGLKSVPESFAKESEYHDVNVTGTNVISNLAVENGVSKFIFSSSAAVYKFREGQSTFRETDQVGPTNPYGQTKLIAENQLKDLSSTTGLKTICFRYFNPVGGDLELMVGQAITSRATALIPRLILCTEDHRDSLEVYGADYPTNDGTCIRDFIGVNDLIRGHICGYQKILSCRDKCSVFDIFNLGTGKGYSVFEIIRQIEQIVGFEISHQVKPRRSGDLPSVIANADKAKEILGWSCRESLEDFCISALEIHRMTKN